MVTIEEQFSQAQSQINQQQEEITQAEKNIQEQRNKLETAQVQVNQITTPARDIKFQLQTIKGNRAIAGRVEQTISQRRDYKKQATSQIKSATEEINQYESNILLPAKSQLQSAQSTLNAQRADYQAYQNAIKFHRKGIPSGFLRGQPEYKYVKEFEQVGVPTYAQIESQNKFNKELLSSISQYGQSTKEGVVYNLPSDFTFKGKNISQLGFTQQEVNANKNVMTTYNSKGAVDNLFNLNTGKLTTPNFNLETSEVPKSSGSINKQFGLATGFAIVSAQSDTQPNIQNTPSTITKAPSWISRTFDFFKGNLKSSGNVVQAGLNTIGATLQSEYSKSVQRSNAPDRFYNYQGMQNLLGNVPNVAYFTPIGPELLIVGGGSKLVSYTISPSILESKSQQVQEFASENFNLNVPSYASKGLVVGADVAEVVGGIFGARRQYQNYKVSKLEPNTMFYAEVTPTDKGTKVNLISTTKGEGLNKNLAISQQFAMGDKIDDVSNIVIGRTYNLELTKDNYLQATKSLQGGFLTQGEKGSFMKGVKTTGNYIDDLTPSYNVGLASDTSLSSKIGSKNVGGIKYDLNNFNWLDSAKGSKFAVDKSVNIKENIGVVFPRGNNVVSSNIVYSDNLLDSISVKVYKNVPDEFIYFGSSNPKLRIYKGGRATLVGKKDIQGIIKIMPDETGNTDILKVFTKSSKGNLELKPEIKTAISSVTQRTTKTYKSIPKANNPLDLMPSVSAKEVPQKTLSITGQSIYTGTGQYEKTDSQILKPITNTKVSISQFQLNNQLNRENLRPKLRYNQASVLDFGLKTNQRLDVSQRARQETKQIQRQKLRENLMLNNSSSYSFRRMIPKETGIIFPLGLRTKPSKSKKTKKSIISQPSRYQPSLGASILNIRLKGGLPKSGDVSAFRQRGTLSLKQLARINQGGSINSIFKRRKKKKNTII